MKPFCGIGNPVRPAFCFDLTYEELKLGPKQEDGTRQTVRFDLTYEELKQEGLIKNTTDEELF